MENEDGTWCYLGAQLGIVLTDSGCRYQGLAFSS